MDADIQAKPTEETAQDAIYREYMNAPPNMVAEVLEGKLHAQPRPASKHAKAYSRLGRKIGEPFDSDDGDDSGGWWIINEPELRFGPNEEDILVPDIAGWRRTNMPTYPDVSYFTLAPDWVCELPSLSTEKIDRTVKRAIYAREGVRYLWLVDPRKKTLEAFELRDGGWALLSSLAGDVQVSLPPFEAISFPLRSLW